MGGGDKVKYRKKIFLDREIKKKKLYKIENNLQFVYALKLNYSRGWSLACQDW